MSSTKSFLAWVIPLWAVLVGLLFFFGACYHGNPPWPTDPTQPPGPFQAQRAGRDAGQDATRSQ
jgi:hypothetical protein